MKQTDKLTDIQIRAYRGTGKLTDGEGMYLLKGKYWRLDYRFAGKRETLPLGVYPEITLKVARELRTENRKLIRDGINPTHKRKAEKISQHVAQNTTFKHIAQEFAGQKKHKWAETTFIKFNQRLEKHIYPTLGKRPIEQIEPPELLEALRRIESTGTLHTAHKIRQYCGQVFRYGISIGKCKRDIARDLVGAIKEETPQNYGHPETPEKIGELLRAIDDYQGDYTTLCALQLLPHLFVRPTELRLAQWTEFDGNLWTIPKGRMKSKRAHHVPLSVQAQAILKRLKAHAGSDKYLFPSIASKSSCMSENTVNTALKRLGFTSREITPHGFRHVASTQLNEQGFNSDWIEMQLAHFDSTVRGNYNKAKYLEQRADMLQQYSNFLDSLKLGTKLTPIRKNSA